jgi:hypothetical protein
MIRGDYVEVTPEVLNDHTKELEIPGDYMLYTTYFRRDCIKAGFTLLKLYPIYYQGWEMDFWGAIGEKDNKQYRLETDHGRLQVTEL